MPSSPPIPILQIGPFGGIVSATSPVYAPELRATSATNIAPERAKKSYATMRGRNLSVNVPPNYHIHGFTKITELGAGDSEFFALVQKYAGDADGGPATIGWIFFDLNNFPLPGRYAPIALSALDDTAGEVIFAVAGNYTYVAYGKYLTGGGLGRAKANGTFSLAGLKTIDHGDATYSGVSIIPTGTGALNGTYSYLFTFADDDQESSQQTMRYNTTPPYAQTSSAFVTAVNQQIQITQIADPPANYPAKYVNIYRASTSGQGGGTYQYIDRIPTFGTHSYTDNIPDTSVTGAIIVPRRDAPPNFFTIRYHNGRIWGLAYDGPAVGYDAASGVNGLCDLWYSNLGEPSSFDSTHQVIDLGRNSQIDRGVALGAVGSTLFAFTTDRTWAIDGSTQADIVKQPAFELGAFSQSMVIEAYGGLYWLTPQFQIWAYAGGLQYISADIQDELTFYGENRKDDIFNGSSFCHDRCLYFSFDSITFVYFIDTGEWYKTTYIANRRYSKPSLRDVQCLSYAADGTTQQISSWFQQDGDFSGPQSAEYTSRITDGDAPSLEKRATHILVMAPIQPGATLNVEITVDPEGVPFTETITFDLSDGPVRHLQSLPSTLTGFTFQVRISTQSSSFVRVDRVTLYAQPMRDLIVARAQ